MASCGALPGEILQEVPTAGECDGGWSEGGDGERSFESDGAKRGSEEAGEEGDRDWNTVGALGQSLTSFFFSCAKNVYYAWWCGAVSDQYVCISFSFLFSKEKIVCEIKK